MDGFDHPSRNMIEAPSHNEDARTGSKWDVGSADARKVETTVHFDQLSWTTLESQTHHDAATTHPIIQVNRQ